MEGDEVLQGDTALEAEEVLQGEEALEGEEVLQGDDALEGDEVLQGEDALEGEEVSQGEDALESEPQLGTIREEEDPQNAVPVQDVEACFLFTIRALRPYLHKLLVHALLALAPYLRGAAADGSARFGAESNAAATVQGPAKTEEGSTCSVA